MAGQRFGCMEKECDRYARLTIQDAGPERDRACPRHAVAALGGLAGARVIWDDSRGVNEHEAAAPRIAEERSQLSSKGAAA
jgi:hypothetical protein